MGVMLVRDTAIYILKAGAAGFIRRKVPTPRSSLGTDGRPLYNRSLFNNFSTTNLFYTRYLLHKIRFIPTNFYARNLLRHMLNQTFFTQRTQELECKKVTSRKLCHAFYTTCFVVAAWQTLPPTPKLHHHHHHHHQKQHHHIDVCMFSQSWKGCLGSLEYSTNVILYLATVSGIRHAWTSENFLRGLA